MTGPPAATRPVARAILSAAYDLAAPDAEWLANITREIASALDVGVGVESFTVDLTGAEHRFSEPQLVGGTSEWRQVWRRNWWDAVMLRMTRAQIDALLGFARVSHTTDLWAAVSAKHQTFDEHLRALARSGFRHALSHTYGHDDDPSVLFYPDSLNLIGLDGYERAIVLAANRPTRGELLTAAARRSWSRIAVHLGTALRLRARHAARHEAAAVLSLRGELLHAEGSARASAAREQLRDAAIAQGRARAVGLSDEETLAHWRALVAGQWSIVDWFDTDGRRFLVARPNELATREGGVLTKREEQVARLVAAGHSNKLIAYELGTAPSTISTLIHRAAGKLGVTSRVEIVRAMRERDARGDDP